MPKLKGPDKGENGQRNALCQGQNEGEGEDVLPDEAVGEISGDGRDQDEGDHTCKDDNAHPKIPQFVGNISRHDCPGCHQGPGARVGGKYCSPEQTEVPVPEGREVPTANAAANVV